MDEQENNKNETANSQSKFQRGVMPNWPGKATHFQLEDRWHTLCGIVHAEYTTDKFWEVNCARCRKTKAFKKKTA